MSYLPYCNYRWRCQCGTPQKRQLFHIFGISYKRTVTRIGFYSQQKLWARRLKVRLGNSENHRLFDPEQKLEADLETNAYLTLSESSEVFLQNMSVSRREWNIPGTKLAKSVVLRRWGSNTKYTCWYALARSWNSFCTQQPLTREIISHLRGVTSRRNNDICHGLYYCVHPICVQVQQRYI